MEESILHAKQAVSLDIKDGQSWCKFPIYFPKFTVTYSVYFFIAGIECSAFHQLTIILFTCVQSV